MGYHLRGCARRLPKDHTFDLRGGLDEVESPVLADMIQVNEAGNAAIAQRLAPIVARSIP